MSRDLNMSVFLAFVREVVPDHSIASVDSIFELRHNLLCLEAVDQSFVYETVHETACPEK